MTKKPFIDHTMDSKETMRLHMNNANLHIRTVLQLSVGVKNVTLQAATQSYLIARLHQHNDVR